MPSERNLHIIAPAFEMHPALKIEHSSLVDDAVAIWRFAFVRAQAEILARDHSNSVRSRSHAIIGAHGSLSGQSDADDVPIPHACGFLLHHFLTFWYKAEQ